MKTDFMQIKESRCSIECPTDFRLYCGGENGLQLYNTSKWFVMITNLKQMIDAFII